jgi:hypothetical protein
VPLQVDGDLGGGARARRHTVTIADHVRRGAATHGRVLRPQGIGREAVQASELAGVSIGAASRHAVIGVIAVRRRIAYDLR